MGLVDIDYTPAPAAPIDMLEHVFDANGWAFERSGDEEISTSIKGGWATYQLRALWREEERVLQIIARADLTCARRSPTLRFTKRSASSTSNCGWDISSSGRPMARCCSATPRCSTMMTTTKRRT